MLMHPKPWSVASDLCEPVEEEAPYATDDPLSGLSRPSSVADECEPASNDEAFWYPNIDQLGNACDKSVAYPMMQLLELESRPADEKKEKKSGGRAKVREPNLEMQKVLRKIAIDHISKCNGCEKCHRLRQKMRMKQAGMEPSQNSGSGTGEQPPAKKPRNSRRNMNKSTAFEEGERVEVSFIYV